MNKIKNFEDLNPMTYSVYQNTKSCLLNEYEQSNADNRHSKSQSLAAQDQQKKKTS